MQVKRPPMILRLTSEALKLGLDDFEITERL